MPPSFHSNETENANLNQYWYSEKTCEILCAAVRESLSQRSNGNARVAFLSTPSLFFSLGVHERKQCTLFDFDDKWRSHRQFEFYDYNFPNKVEASLHGKFDLVVIDPPFISHAVWENYGTTAALLAKEDAHIICTTIDQNEQLMKSLFGCQLCNFKPTIPTLIYQYNCYANFPSEALSTINSELTQDS